MNYRPVILLGNGVRGNTALIEHLCSLGIPIFTTWMACDLIPEDHPSFCGRPGILGQRAANIIQQKATHFYAFGARLDPEQVFYDYKGFSPNAQKWVYDIDESERTKFPDGWCVFSALALVPFMPKGDLEWLLWCKNLYNRFRPELDGIKTETKFVDPFYFMRLLSDAAKADDVLAIGSSGNAPTTFFQTFKVKQGQRISNACTIGAMGADIPMALGAALASGRRTICVTGDGGFQLNTQELETIRRLRLPVTFFVWNNNGYASIRNNQKLRFDGHVMGADPKSGLTLPSLELIADAYRFIYTKLDARNIDDLEKCILSIPHIVEVIIDPDWVQYPRVMARMENGQYIRDDMADMSPKVDDLAELMKWGG